MTQDFKISIYESGLNPDEKDYLLYLVEKKTEREYRRRQMEKYYKMRYSKNKDRAIMDINGEKIRTYIKPKKDPYTSSMDVETGILNLNMNKMSKIKGARCRDAIIQHEMGHRKLHGWDTNKDSGLDMKKTNYKTISDNIDSQLELDRKKRKDQKPDYQDILIGARYKNQAKKYFLTHGDQSDPDIMKKRDEFRKSQSKYTLDNGHTDISELEADQYAANRSGTKYMIRGLRRANKNDKKELIKKVKHDIGKITSDPSYDKDKRKVEIKRLSDKIKKQNMADQADMQSRNQALRNKETSDSARAVY